MNKNLEFKIMDRIYHVEAKRTGLSLLLKTIEIILVGSAVILFTQIIWEYITEGQIIGMFISISEDRDIFFAQIAGVLQVLFDEIPLPLVISVIVGMVICIVIVLTIVANFGKIRNRIRAMVLYWRHR